MRNRWIWVGVIVAMIIVAIAAMERPDWFPGGLNIASVMWALMALLLVSGAAYGFPRLRQNPGTALVSLLIWVAIIVAIVLAYNAFN
ncbi:MAG: hypothetical protein AB7O98_19340 [Hyphomonadaceae bacterium]